MPDAPHAGGNRAPHGIGGDFRPVRQMIASKNIAALYESVVVEL